MKSLCLLLSAGLALAGFAEKPSFSLLNRGLYYPLSRDLRFPYESVGVSNLEITVSKCFVNNLNAYRLGTDEMTSRMKQVLKRRIELDPPFGQKMNRILDLSELMREHGPGFYRLQASTGVRVRPYDWSSCTEELTDGCLFALTDLGLAAEVSDSKTAPRAVVLVHSLKDARPLVGVRVSVMTRANQVVGEGVTDARGVADIPLANSFRPGEDEVYGILATWANDVSYLQLDGNSAVRFRDDDGQRRLEDVRAFLFAERDICRPGEAFDTGLFLRTSPEGGLKALGLAPVELELFDPDDNRVETRRLMTDRWGFLASTWRLPASAQVGSWRVVARLAGRELGSFAVNVSAYVPDRFRVELKAERTESTVAFRGSAVYYFGENVREGNWKLSVEPVLAPAAPHWDGWTVGTGEIPKGLASAAKGALDEGAFAVTHSEKLFAELMKSKSPVLLNVEASVSPPGARTVTAREQVRLDPSDRYVGVRETTAPLRGTRAFEVAFLPAAKGAAVSTNGEISVKFVRREWTCHAVESGTGYRMEWRETKTEVSSPRRTMRPGVMRFADSNLESGNYQLVATCGELETRLDFWHWAGEVSERSVSPSALTLRGGRERVKPGEEVRLAFDSGYEGYAYVAVGERGIERTDVFAVRKGENAFTVKVRPDAAGRYTYVSVTVVNAAAPNVRRLSGLARLRVDHANRRLPLGLKVPEVVKPGATVDVCLKSDGPAAVRLMAVDEGVLALTGYAAPDAFGYFYDYDFGCPFGVYDLYSGVYPDLRILPNGQIGGGAFNAILKRRNVRTRRDSTLKQRESARVVLPLVEIPASGEATVPMTVPAFTGSMRLMAVAVDDTRAGGAATAFVVRDAASLFVNAPRTVTGGDSYELVAEVFNHDLPASDWTLDVGGRSFAGRLEMGASTNVTFAVSVPEDAVGAKPVVGVLKIGGETFRDEVAVTVRPKRPLVTEVSYRHLPTDVTLDAVKEPANDWLRLDEDVTDACGSPRDVIAGALKWLGDYPYGCLEQVTAAAFPFLAAESLRKLGLADIASASNAAAKVKAAYGEILQMSSGDGSFAMWPGGRGTWADGSLFALHFVFAAERLGLVKPEPRAPMVRWLRRQADGNDPRTRLNRAYAAYVLAVAGEDGCAVPARNVLATDECDFASFLAAAALVRGGYRAEGELRYRQALKAGVWETFRLPASDCWSRTRAYGMTLAIVSETLSDASASEAVAPLVGKLTDALRRDASAWGTTRDNAWAAAGLATFSAAHPNGGTYVRRIRTGIPRTPPARAQAVRAWRNWPSRVKKGDLVHIEIRLAATREVDRAVLADLLPGGFELEDGVLKTRSGEKFENPGRSEIRDDRWLWFGSLPAHTEKDRPQTLRYRARAVSRGTFAVPALTVEDMYDPDCSGFVDAAGTVTVE